MSLTLVLLLAVSVEPAPAPPPVAATPGPVVAVGGGGVPDSVRHRILELAGGADAALVVIPFASQRENAGPGGAEAWREAGAENVTVLVRDPEEARAQLEGARVLWFGGGCQNRRMDALRELDLLELVRARHRDGAVLAGSSAGAAVMSGKMITGEADLESVRHGATELVEGIGAWSGVIVDQHFLARRRTNRLLAAVLDHPELIGVGIDEGTAAIWREGAIEVVGRSQVMIIDARRAAREEVESGRHHAARGLEIHVLREGLDPWPIGPTRVAPSPRRASL